MQGILNTTEVAKLLQVEEKVAQRELKKALYVSDSGVFKIGGKYRVMEETFLNYLINKEIEKIIEEKVRLKELGLRRNNIKIKYNNFTFNTISDLARKINVNVKCIRSFMYTHNIKSEDCQIDLNSLKYKEFREYIEKKDKQKNLIPFKDKIKTFAKENDISLYKINLLIDEKNIKSIDELKKYYQYI